jgi:hypothetical protein
MAWEVLWEKGGVRLRCHGALTEADIVEGIDAMQQDPRFDTLRWNINDFSEVHNLADLPGYIEDATARAIGGAYTNPQILMAVVMPDPVFVERSRANIPPDFPYRVGIFTDMPSARDWIENSGA